MQTENNMINDGGEKKPFDTAQGRSVGKKEKIILIVLAIVFFAVLTGAGWDLYGRKAMTNYLCTTQNTGANDNQMATTATSNNQNTSVTGQKQANTDGMTKSAEKTDNNIAYSSYSTCLENTKDAPTAKDCCDCLSGDASLHKACRDATVNYDFSKNTVIKTFTIPSKLGPSGDYSTFTASGNQQQCKQACESASSGLVCGDYRYCRTACDKLAQ